MWRDIHAATSAAAPPTLLSRRAGAGAQAPARAQVHDVLARQPLARAAAAPPVRCRHSNRGGLIYTVAVRFTPCRLESHAFESDHRCSDRRVAGGVVASALSRASRRSARSGCTWASSHRTRSRICAAWAWCASA
eukprot:3864967-Prymnesium_polylepis.1